MLPPFSKVSGSAPFSKGHVSFLAPFFKGFWKCSLFQGSCQLFGTLFSVSGSASFSKGQVSFLAPFFKGFWKCFLFQGSCQLFAPFLKGFWMCFLFQGSCQFFQKLTVHKSPLLQRFASTWFSKIPFSKVLFQSVSLFQRFLEVLLIPHGPFSKG